MKYFKWIFLFLELLSIEGFSQNLVLNPSFEDSKEKKKEKISDIDQLSFCLNPSKGTPDLISLFSKSALYKSPNNVMGFQKPHTGEIYIGIVIGNYPKSSFYNNLREYVTIELKEVLKPNNLYCVGMYISLANNVNYASDGIGVYLSNEKFKTNQENLLLTPFFKSIIPNTYNISNKIISDTLNWVYVCDTIRVKGGEKYITIGNFKSDDSTKFIKIHRRTNSYFDAKTSYYFIDDVSVIASNSNDCKCNETKQPLVAKVETPQPIKENVPVVMEELFFETKKYDILPKSYHYLDSLCVLLSKTTNIIEISGHTDNVGTEKDNQLLSENRAKAVMAYMVSKGILQTRVSAKGYGSTKPVTSNETEKGRANNRRVEFKVLKKQ